MTIHYEDATVTLHHGDCLEVLRAMPDASVDSVVTDPPYGLGFMGKEWDSGKSFVERKAAKRNTFDHVGGNHNPTSSANASRTRRVESRKFGEWCELWTAECFRVLKPGGHLLAFGGTRTWHRLACAVEDAGFEVRDSIAWLYGSGFPKSLDVSKAIDKRRDWSLVERLSGEIRRARAETGLSLAEIGKATQDATDGTYGKWYHRGGHMFFETGRSLPSRPEWEHLRHVLPIAPEFVEVYDEAEREVIGSRTVNGAEGSAGGYADGIASQRGLGGVVREIDITAPATPDAERWQGWGTALKPAFEPVVVARKPLAGTVAANVLEHGTGALNIDGCRVEGEPWTFTHSGKTGRSSGILGESAAREGVAQSHPAGRWPTNVVLDDTQAAVLDEQSGDLAAGNRPRVRNADENRTAYGTFEGQSDLEQQRMDSGGASRFFPTFRYEAKAPQSERPKVNGTAHPTVKPLDLMRWLVRLVTPPGGTVLEPFAGSGATVEACVVEGFHCVAIEKTDEYLPLITQRINRQRDPVAYMHAAGDDLGLFDLT